MGVAGSGKTTIGTRLAGALQCAFLDADSLHSAQSVDRMRRGIPLTDADRTPWLVAIHARMLDALRSGRPLVVACSALTWAARRVLAADVPITWVYLKGSEDLIRARLARREGHFARAELLTSQLEALEEPADAIVADISRHPDAIVHDILAALRLASRETGGRAAHEED